MEYFKNFIEAPNLTSLGFLILAASLFWLKSVIPAFLKATHDTRLEIFKRKLLRDEKAFVIAELTALMLNGVKSEKDAIDINKRIFELCLILPPSLVHAMAHTYVGTGTKEDLDHFGLFLEIRKFIEGNYKDDGRPLTKENIPWVRFPSPVPPEKTGPSLRLSLDKPLRVKLEGQLEY
jgi:hypothetical protein